MANSNVKKPTKKENLINFIARYPNDSELVAYCEHEIELLDRKKSNGNTKANKQAIENVELVYNALASVGKAVTVTELIAQTDLSALANDEGVVTTQRVRAYIGKLIESGRAKTYKDKKKTLFEIVVTDNDIEE
jgi:hypothetical protein